MLVLAGEPRLGLNHGGMRNCDCCPTEQQLQTLPSEHVHAQRTSRMHPRNREMIPKTLRAARCLTDDEGGCCRTLQVSHQAF